MKSLLAEHNKLAIAAEQIEILQHGQPGGFALVPFQQKLEETGLYPLNPTNIETFQVNVGKMCNQVCKHCHVDAGPDRKEIMTKETMQQCLEALKNNPSLKTVDLTGEIEYKHALMEKYGIGFNNLYAITNLPISRFLDYLLQTGNYEKYMEKLVDAYNPIAAQNVMCRNTISVGWDGSLYDCDFNQMLELKLACSSNHISQFNIESLNKRNIVIGQHCYGCTAGAGSSCGGAVT
eukprot:jgi/Mesen1/2547/ME001615S01638